MPEHNEFYEFRFPYSGISPMLTQQVQLAVFSKLQSLTRLMGFSAFRARSDVEHEYEYIVRVPESWLEDWHEELEGEGVYPVHCPGVVKCSTNEQKEKLLKLGPKYHVEVYGEDVEQPTFPASLEGRIALVLEVHDRLTSTYRSQDEFPELARLYPNILLGDVTPIGEDSFILEALAYCFDERASEHNIWACVEVEFDECDEPTQSGDG